MLSSSLHGYFDIQSVTSPQPTHQKVNSPGVHPPLNIELDQLAFGVKYNGPVDYNPTKSSAQEQQPPQITSQPMTPNELEMSRPPSPSGRQAVESMQTWNSPLINKWRILACCVSFMGNGLNDAAIGALIPYMEVHYQISYAIMSLVFVGTALGFITAAFFTKMILVKLERAKTLMLAELIMASSYVIIVCTPPYPLVIIAFFLCGYGAAINLALNNVFCTSLQPTSAILGAAHGSYGLGGIIAPIIGTAIASRGVLWSRFYLIPLVLRLFCMVFSGWIFWSYKEESHDTLLTPLEMTNSRQDAVAEMPVSKLHDLKMALKNRVTIMGALFIFVYQGAEVSVSGWVISFLINYRDGDPARMGYVTAGFWTGITLGRFILTHLAPYIGEKRFVVILTLGSLSLQLMAWLIPNVIGNAVAVALLGLLLGPIYPCAQTIFSRLMPRHVLTTALGFIAGAGSSGGAVAPFTTGILAQAAGTWVLHPVCVSLYVVMLGCWVALPRVRKRTE